ncbi:NAD(P)-dependent oxidoreductase [Mucilaginibacter gilvus]|uniref:NAD(P)-dependent oxidoreductase n=1 Tax=Mucilaginibacter gilvus TaxID=2305909 RepID=UPI001ABA99CA|nr:NAD(P)-dependent oxidoreductase [Mucilaginibacter gilvus]
MERGQVELTNRKIGIIGLGTTGRMLADRALVFKMDVSYYSRTRKEEAEDSGLKYLPLDELLKQSEIISIHLPKSSVVLTEREFNLFGEGKILINTSLGLTFEKSSFLKWMQIPSNFSIFDGDGIGQFKQEFGEYERIISSDVVSGWTMEAKKRLAQKVIENIKNYLNV